MAQIKYIMTTKLVTAEPTETVLTVTNRMKENHLGAILIVEDDKLAGIFSERDLLTRVVSANKDPNTTPMSEVATLDPIAVLETTNVKECAEILEEKNFRHLPIVNAEGKLTGVISSRDFFKYVTKELERVIDRVRSKEGATESFDPYEFFGGGGFGVPRDSK